MGLVTVIGRGGVHVEVDRDFVIHVGGLPKGQLPALVNALRCAPLLYGHRGRPPLAMDALDRTVRQLHRAVLEAGVSEVELNPVLLTQDAAWVLDALVTI
jgi:hypothetical protein